MELTPVRSFLGYSVYKTKNGATVKMKKGTGKVEVNDKGVLIISGGEKVQVSGTRGDDKIVVKDSNVSYISTDSGKDRLLLDNCTYKQYKPFWGTGSAIFTGGAWYRKKNKDDFAEIMINGDFNGYISAQQGVGKGWGDDSDAHRDYIKINGNNKGRINIDTRDRVQINGEKGSVRNTTVYYI